MKVDTKWFVFVGVEVRVALRARKTFVLICCGFWMWNYYCDRYGWRLVIDEFGVNVFVAVQYWTELSSHYWSFFVQNGQV